LNRDSRPGGRAAGSVDRVVQRRCELQVQRTRIELDTVLRTPIFDFQSCATTARLPALNGVQNTYYCGSYFGYGLHEDAIRFAVEVARGLGVEPWQRRDASRTMEASRTASVPAGDRFSW
jgi:predicted NAD/FAD-binding protein